MNECCDWHAVIVTTKDHDNYISFCPECLTFHEVNNGKLFQVFGSKSEQYKNLYAQEILAIFSSRTLQKIA